MSKKKENLHEIVKLINNNIKLKGKKRFDPLDIRDLYIVSKNDIISKCVRIVLLLAEEVFPLFLRKILKTPKDYYPTTFTHLAEAYLLAEKLNDNLLNDASSIKTIEEAMEKYLRNDEGEYYWIYKENYKFVDLEIKNRRATMPMHALARLNIILLKLGNYYNVPKYIDIAYKSAKYAMQNHQIIDYGDGTKSISYFYNSIDCTINVNTEFAQWLSMIPSNLRDEKMNKMIIGIIKLIIKEQNNDGSWYYFSKYHMEKWGNKPSIDCHHTGTVLNNLINILQSDILPINLRNELIYSINRGMRFYINNFFDLNSGKAKTLIGYKRKAGPVQYSEAILAFCEYLKSNKLSDYELKSQVRELLPKVVSSLVSLINKRDGSASSGKVFKWVSIDSIRWGNGPALQAIISFLSILG